MLYNLHMDIKLDKLSFILICGLLAVFFGRMVFAQDSSADLFLSSSGQEMLSSQDYKKNLVKGLDYLALGLNEEAKEAFWRAISIFPQNPDAYVNLGTIYIEEGNYESADRVFAKAKALSNKDYYQREILLYNLGLSLFKQEAYLKAIANFKEALEVYSGFSEAYYYLGRSLEATGQKEQAYVNVVIAKYLFQNEAKLTSYQKANSILAVIKEEFEFNFSALAEKIYEQALKFSSDNTDKALYLLAENIALDPQNSEAYYKVGQLYFSRGQYNESLLYFRKLIDLKPNLKKAYIGLGRVYRKLRLYSLAIESFKRTLEFDEDHAVVYYHIGRVYLDDSKKDLAKSYFAKAKKIATKNDEQMLLEKIEAISGNYKRQKVAKPIIVAGKRKIKKSSKSGDPYYFTFGNQGNFSDGVFIPAAEPRQRTTSYILSPNN